jgi:hypothetical protein
MGCTNEINCPDYEDWGEFSLKENSKLLLENLESGKTAVFIDSVGNTFEYTISRIELFYEEWNNCDQDDNGLIESGEPLVFNSRLQSISISYRCPEFYTIHLSLSVGQYPNFDPLTKENFESNIFDRLLIGIDAYYNQISMNWIVDKRTGSDPPPYYNVNHSEELLLGSKSFVNVYWDDKHLINGINKYIIYFNGDYGIIGIRNSENGHLLHFDHFK